MLTAIFEKARFLIVDDEPQNINVLTQMLKLWNADNVVGITDPRETFAMYESMQPDIILLDLMMPGMDGFEILGLIHPMIPPDVFLPILVLTADTTDHAKRRALSLGASDFMSKPFDATELSLRLYNLLTRRSLQLRLKENNERLDQQINERTLQLARAEIETVECLAVAGEYRDDATGEHTRRVGRMCERIAKALGIHPVTAALIGRAAPLHDIGKIGIPDSILLKPGKLTYEEFEVMQTHTTIGAAILARHHTEHLQVATSIALTHHERWDGRGYPNGLEGDCIPIAGRIVAVCDVFDALTHNRPYKEAWPAAVAAAEIQRQAGAQFDPAVVAAFSKLLPELT